MRYFLLFLVFIVTAGFFVYLRSQQRKEEQKGKPVQEKGTVHESALARQNREYLEKQKQHQQELINDQMNLHYGDVLLRPVVPEDEKPLAVILNNRKVADYANLPVIKRISQMKPLMKIYMDTVGVYAIVLLSTERVIGLAELIDDKDAEAVGFRIFIGKQYWRHGFGTDAVEALLIHAKKEGFKAAVIQVNPENQSGVEFVKSLGFKEVSPDRFICFLDKRKSAVQDEAA